MDCYEQCIVLSSQVFMNSNAAREVGWTMGVDELYVCNFLSF